MIVKEINIMRFIKEKEKYLKSKGWIKKMLWYYKSSNSGYDLNTAYNIQKLKEKNVAWKNNMI